MSKLVGLPATGSHAYCLVCGYGTVQADFGRAAVLIHAASCPERVRDRLVACDHSGCRKVLDPRRVRDNDARTCNSRCRAAAWKEANGYGKHPETAQDTRAGRTNANGQRRKPSGLQVSYRKAVDELAAYFLTWDDAISAERARDRATDALRPALSDRQRQLLDQRKDGTS